MDKKYTNSERIILKTIGANIRKLRQHRGFTQETLAFECDLDRTYIGGIERGERNLAALNIVRIARALTVPIAEIFKRVNIKYSPSL